MTSEFQQFMEEHKRIKQLQYITYSKFKTNE
jgi:hypothetical protein